MTVWVTGDYHFSHNNIVKYCNRPFQNVEEMNEFIISKHNELVKPEDTVIFLGDFKWYEGTIKEYLNNLNGHFIFVKGNHDSSKAFKKEKIPYHDFLKIKINNKLNVFLTHNPENAKKGLNLVAHVHDEWFTCISGNKTMINVGVDKNNFRPHDLKELIRTFKIIDDIFFIEIDFGTYKINMG